MIIDSNHQVQQWSDQSEILLQIFGLEDCADKNLYKWTI